MDTRIIAEPVPDKRNNRLVYRVELEGVGGVELYEYNSNVLSASRPAASVYLSNEQTSAVVDCVQAWRAANPDTHARLMALLEQPSRSS